MGFGTVSGPDGLRLAQLRLGLQEKLDVLKGLDGEILDAIDDEEALTSEIEQSDDFRQGIYQALVRIEKTLEALPIPAATPSGTGTGHLDTANCNPV